MIGHVIYDEVGQQNWRNWKWRLFWGDVLGAQMISNLIFDWISLGEKIVVFLGKVFDSV